VNSRHDVVVIGAGPAGEAAAELGGSLGYSVALNYGYKLAAGDTLVRQRPDVLRGMRLPSRAHRI
jgi:pyruvate/2-oxoglutarate dehydrogenase complex dihydrolipoamide dehydrogenase (E3) component